MTSQTRHQTIRRAIIVVGKPAMLGRAKTRLAESIGEQMAADVYARFLEDISALVERTSETLDGDIRRVLAWTIDEDHDSYTPFHRAGFDLWEQPDGDLGHCMQTLVERALDAGADQAVIIGTDSPTLHTRHLADAFTKLDEGADVVLGPSFDGGYYMIGLSGPHGPVFEEIEWSTGDVLSETLKRARAAQLLCELSEFWYDVDTLGDLKKMRAHLFEFLQFRHPNVAAETRRFLEMLPQGVLDE